MQLADFGLAVWAADVTSQMTCNDVAGTFGFVVLASVSSFALCCSIAAIALLT